MMIPIYPYSRHKSTDYYHHGLLPHLRQKGCAYFVTFRQADSLPQSVIEELKFEMGQLQGLSEDERIEIERQIAIKLNKALDLGVGSCMLRKTPISKVVDDALNFHHETRVYTGDYSIMPNHVHVILTPIADHKLEDILQSIKSYSANKINKQEDRSGEFWQRESYDHIIRDKEQLVRVQKYIANNPSKANLTADQTITKAAEYNFYPSAEV